MEMYGGRVSVRERVAADWLQVQEWDVSDICSASWTRPLQALVVFSASVVKTSQKVHGQTEGRKRRRCGEAHTNKQTNRQTEGERCEDFTEISNQTNQAKV